MIDLYGDLQLRGIKYTLSGIEDDNNDISQQHNFLFLILRQVFLFTRANCRDFLYSSSISGTNPTTIQMPTR